MDPRTTLIRAACWHLLLFSARLPQAEKNGTATQRMLQNDVLENGIFKPRPKLAESSSKLARWAPSQLVVVGVMDSWILEPISASNGELKKFTAVRILKVFKLARLVRLLRAKVLLIKRHFPAWKRPLGLAMFRLWPWSRAWGTRLLRRGGADTWAEIWARRSEWKDGWPE